MSTTVKTQKNMQRQVLSETPHLTREKLSKQKLPIT